MAEAVVALEKAERGLMSGLNALLGSSTLQYSHRFEAPAEEYAHELDRHLAYRDLVPLAIAELKPRREAVGLVERYVAASARHLVAARAHAAGIALARPSTNCDRERATCRRPWRPRASPSPGKPERTDR